MSRYRKVEVQVWTNEAFRALSSAQPNGQTLWLYLLTGPRTISIPGVVIGREAVMADDLGWSVEGFREAFAEAFREGLAEGDWKAGLVVLRKALIDSTGAPRDTTKPESPNVIRGWAKSWDEIPECDLKSDLLQRLHRYSEALGEAFAKAFREAFAKPLAKPSRKVPATLPETRRQETGDRRQESGEREGDRFAFARSPAPKGPTPARKPASPKPPVPGQQETVAAFHDAYLAQNGVPPTWGAKQAGQIKQLVTTHGADEVQRRIGILFDGRGPAFLAGPFDVGTLVQHFDKLAKPSAPARASPGGVPQGSTQIALAVLAQLEAEDAERNRS